MRPGLRRVLVASWLLGGMTACDAVLSLGNFSVVDGSRTAGEDARSPDGAPDAEPDVFVGECTTNQECIDRATLEGEADVDAGSDGAADSGEDGGPIAAVCVKPQYKCARLRSVDCPEVLGDYTDDNAVVIGTMFSTTGSQASTNIPRKESALLAAEEINKAGGLPPLTAGGARRPLVVVSCDEVANLVRAGAHLTEDLHVPAIIGPNTSQDVLDISQKVTVKAGTLVMSPTGVASSIADLEDDNLTWRLIPSDVQRAPLMIEQLNEIEGPIKADRGKSSLKLAIIYKNDAFGVATFNSLSPMKWNGAGLSDAANLDKVKIDSYDPTAADLGTLVAKYRDFQPDVIALIGTAEAVTKVLAPLEAAWNGGPDRPHYVLTDSSKVSDLLNVVKGNEDLRSRLRGTGVTPQSSSIPVFNAFTLTFQSRYGKPANQSGMGQSYDAMYAVAYAMATVAGHTPTGKEIAVGLRSLSDGATVLDVGSQKILAAFQLLSEHQKITVNGTYGALEWDSKGDTLGTIEMWCVTSGATPAYASSGLTFNTKTQQLVGSYTQCP